MGKDDSGTTFSTPQTFSAAARAAGEAAARAGLAASAAATSKALVAAAENAAQPGHQSSEYRVGVGAIVLTGVTAALSAALHFIPFMALGPFALPAVAIGAGLTAGLYAISRGNVKAAAIDAAQAALYTMAAASTAPPVDPPK